MSISSSISEDNLVSTIKRIVQETPIIDVHSHLFPSAHKELCLYGIDYLLTYHYLISELFVVWSEMDVSKFYELSLRDQANIVWEQLFIFRSPISEACQGVITTCQQLGLGNWIEDRNLDMIREYFENLKDNPKLLEDYLESIFEKSKIKYTIMTNQIFDHQEIKLWTQTPTLNLSHRFKTSLRIDPLIININKTGEFIKQYGYPVNINGFKNYLRDWNKRINPEYLMASLPSDFIYSGKEITATPLISESNLSPSQVIDLIIIPIALELNLPVAFKFGTQRMINPRLKSAGDSLGVSSVESLANLCRKHPRCKFLATFLSLVNQHQLCTIARNFQNLHIYGCWWFLNNPSLIKQITEMRIEMLGWGFTVQHSDARVVEQLLYKWSHSKDIIIDILIDKFKSLILSGWLLNEDEVSRDIQLLFYKSYESFMSKNLIVGDDSLENSL